MTLHWEPANQYSILAADWSTGTIRDEIPFSNFNYGAELNAPAPFSGTVTIKANDLEHLTEAVVPSRITRANLDPARTIIWVLRRGLPVWGGFLWSFKASLNQREVAFDGSDFFSYYERRTINKTLTYSSSTDDQFSIVEALISYAAAQGGGNIGTVVNYSALSGRKRDRTYWGFERKQISEAITQLGAVNDGFEWSIDYSGSLATGLGHILRLHYPTRGRETNIVFDARKNVQLLDWTGDGQRMATTVYAQGSGEGDNMVQGQAVDTSLLDGSYPLLETVTQYKDVVLQETITRHAEQDLKMMRMPVETYEVEVRPDDTESAIGSFIVGDQVRLVAQEGFVDIDTQARITGYTVNVSEDGEETIRVRLAQVEALA